MASPLALGLATALALSSTSALGCVGQGCWGMAPAQEKNPGYTGPDYAALYGPPGGYGQGGYGDPYGQPGYGQGYGMDYGASQSGRPYAGPVEGYPVDEYQNADGSSPSTYTAEAYPPAQYAQGYGAPPPQYGQGAPPMDDPNGPPPEDQGGYGPEAYGGEQGPPEEYGPPDQGGYDQGGYDQGGQGGYDQGGYDQGGPDQGGYDQGGYAEAGPPPMADEGAYGGGYAQGYEGPAHGGMGGMAYGTEPYEGRWARGHEAYRDSGWNHGYRHRSYRSFDKSKYVYDSGWQVQYGPTEVYDLGVGWGGGHVVGRF